MGLDVFAANHVKYCKEEPTAETSCTCIDASDVRYTSHSCDLQKGYYRPSAASEVHVFRAGSYGSYNEWRDDLSRMALGVPAEVAWESPEDFALRPFFGLIDFSDCEGVIGPSVCKLLARQFADFQKTAEGYDKDHEGFLAMYNDFRKAFELGAEGGLVEFC